LNALECGLDAFDDEGPGEKENGREVKKGKKRSKMGRAS
jgi:hypothetical protein